MSKSPRHQAFKHPRSVYTLPNGDVLAVESTAPKGEAITRPKDLIVGLGAILATGWRRRRG